MEAVMGTKKKTQEFAEVEEDYSLNDVVLRGRVSQEAVEKELPSGDKVVEFRLIVTREKQSGVDTLDIASWSAKSRRIALSLTPDEWVEVSGSIHRRFWSSPSGLASRWQVEALEISRI
jgi:single-strand DNA-binding protein